MTAIILDTETTDKNEPQVIEAVFFRMDDMTEIGEKFNQRYRPSKPITFGAMATHHILEEDLTECPPHTDYKLPGDVQYIIGHNIDFDWKVSGSPDIKRICTLAMARKVWPDADSHSLGALCYMLSSDKKATREALRNAHSALADVLLCHDLLMHIYAKVGPFADWESLWKFSEAARIPERITFGKHAGMRIAEIPADYKRWLLGQSDIDPYLRKALKGETA
jgi:exodeoxyribonuclease X